MLVVEHLITLKCKGSRMFKYIKYTEVETEFTKLTFVRKNEDVKVIFF